MEAVNELAQWACIGLIAFGFAWPLWELTLAVKQLQEKVIELSAELEAGRRRGKMKVKIYESVANATGKFFDWAEDIDDYRLVQRPEWRPTVIDTKAADDGEG